MAVVKPFNLDSGIFDHFFFHIQRPCLVIVQKCMVIWMSQSEKDRVYGEAKQSDG